MSRDISLLHPNLQIMAHELIRHCKNNGINIGISQTLRTKAEQDNLYAQGRTKPGKIVTNVQYPYSKHCWGVAFDVFVQRNGKAIWDTAAYRPVGDLGERIGLVWGGRWRNFPDAPHFELPGHDVKTLIAKYKDPQNFIKTWKKGGGYMTVEKKDDAPSAWAKKAWEWATKEGFVDGTNPKGNVTREQLAAILERLAHR